MAIMRRIGSRRETPESVVVACGAGHQGIAEKPAGHWLAVAAGAQETQCTGDMSLPGIAGRRQAHTSRIS